MQQHHALRIEGAVKGEEAFVPAEESRIRRSRHPAPRTGGSGVPFGSAELDQRRVPLLRAQQGKGGGLVDDGHGPVLQVHRCGGDLPGGAGGEGTPGGGGGLAQRLTSQQVSVQVGHVLGSGDDVDVVAHRHHPRHPGIGHLSSQRPIRPDPRMHIRRQLTSIHSLAFTGLGAAP